MRRKAHDTAERTEEGERLHATMVKCRAAMRCRKALARWQHAAWVAVCAACSAKQWKQTLEAKAMRSWRAAADAAAADRAAREAAAGGAAALKTLRSAFEAWGGRATYLVAAGCAVFTAIGFLAAIPARRRAPLPRYPLVDDDVSPPNRAQP